MTSPAGLAPHGSDDFNSRLRSHASREGQPFRVGNIGNNGLMYLRPVNRIPQHTITPPTTPPPATTPASYLLSDHERASALRPPSASDIHATGPATPLPTMPDQTDTAATIHKPFPVNDNIPLPRQTPLTTRGKVRMIVNRQTSKRAKLSDVVPVDSHGAHDLLGILIPHYRLGTPYFTGHGSPILQSSMHTDSSINGDVRSSLFSQRDYESRFPAAPGVFRQPVPPNKSHLSALNNNQVLRTQGAPTELLPLDTNFNPWTEIPTMQPLSSYMEDPALIRLSSVTGQLIAATPSRLIAQITSPNLLDYDLLSDFFLTFRSFLSPQRLVAQLIARLQWAVSHVDDFGRVVRVRAFVALRHWILNYFADDFVPDYDLRWHFCRLVNAMCYELRLRRDSVPGDLKILGELKRCWRRTYALYWDVPLPKKPEGIMDKIEPGGRMDSRGLSNVDPRAKNDLQAKIARRSRFTPNASMSGIGVPFVPQYDSSEPQPFSVNVSAPFRHHNARWSTSEASVSGFTCSIPAPIRSKIKSRAKAIRARGPRPVPVPDSADPSQRMVEEMFNEAQPRRSGSFVNSLRDEREPFPAPQTTVEDPVASTALPGNLIRGIILQPFTPYIDNVAPTTPPMKTPFRDCDTLDHIDPFEFDDKNSAAFNPRTKKMFGNVKRALSTRTNNPSSTARSIKEHISNLPGRSLRPSTAPNRKAPGEFKRDQYPSHGKPRIDLLAASVAESFRRATVEDVNVEAARMPALRATPVASRQPTRQPTRETLVPRGAPPSPPAEPIEPIGRRSSDASMGSFSLLMLDETEYTTSDIRSASARHDDMDTELVPEVPQSQYTMPGVSYARLSRASASANAIQLPSRPLSQWPMIDSLQHSGRSESQDQEAWPLPPSGTDSPIMDRPRSRLFIQPDEEIRYHDSAFNPHEAEPRPRLGHGPDSAGSHAPPSFTNEPHTLDRAPRHQLRRRPGGDLSKADNVQDLMPAAPSMTSDAMSRFTRSMTNHTRSLPAAFNSSSQFVGRRRLSLMETHSSQVGLRPSFELQVARLAQLPDMDEDGGIESALLKLEGRDRRDLGGPEGAVHIDPPMPTQFFGTPPESIRNSFASEPSFGNREDDYHDALLPQTTLVGEEQHDHAHRRQRTRIMSSPLILHKTTEPGGLRAIFAASYPSSPMLQQFAHTTMAEHMATPPAWMSAIVARQQERRAFARNLEQKRTNSSEALLAPWSVDDLARKSSDTHRSFLLDDDESIVTVSDDGDEDQDGEPVSFYNHDSSSLVRDGQGFSHIDRLPPTPPPQLDPIPHPSPLLDPEHKVKLLQTPAPVPKHIPLQDRVDYYQNGGSTPGFPRSKSNIDIRDIRDRPLLSTTPAAAHFPFILAYDTKTTAEQFTLIEKDALSEIDWRELIEIRWAQSAPVVRNWVEYLRQSRAMGADADAGAGGSAARGGVDVCIARFNVMVKWAVSEVVLTQDVYERAACLVKYIHIARHCRRIRNWATMYQITTALVSADCQRLRRTWALVPTREQEELRQLEALIMPTRNFHNLRVEMEAMSLDADPKTDPAAGAAGAGSPASTDPAGAVPGACIPFIGIYTHDLIYNAQKPAYVQTADPADPAPAAPGARPAGAAESLVNFDRARAAAAIVKNLLRMLEASSRYDYTPVADLLSRCLWMAALGDGEIARKSRELEP